MHRAARPPAARDALRPPPVQGPLHPLTGRVNLHFLARAGHQLECSQGSLAQCHTICDNLKLLPLYNTTCYDYCGSSTGCK